MNARIDLRHEDDVVSVVDLLEGCGTAVPVPRITVPSMSPVALVRRATGVGAFAAAVAGVCTLGYALASASASAEQTPWLVAFVATMAFSFGASLGGVSSLIAQHRFALASSRVRDAARQNGM